MDVNDWIIVSRMFDNFIKDYEGWKCSGNEMVVIWLIGLMVLLFKNYFNVWLYLLFNIF